MASSPSSPSPEKINTSFSELMIKSDDAKIAAVCLFTRQAYYRLPLANLPTNLKRVILFSSSSYFSYFLLKCVSSQTRLSN